VAAVKKKMLNWARRFNIFCFLDNQDYSIQPQQYECLLAAGVHRQVVSDDINEIDAFIQKGHWLFGHLSYDLKNELHGFHPTRQDHVGFPHCFFFEPLVLLALEQDRLTISGDHPEQVFEQLMNADAPDQRAFYPVTIEQCISREEYLRIIGALQQHIVRGDCYEINFCQEFFARNTVIDPVDVFEKLTYISPNPFSALYRLDDRYLICASPERFLTKRGHSIFSQPMKGTIKRNNADPIEDERLKQELNQSAKDQSENVMVVDMVRNDLSRVCKEGSVKVNELFGVYSYPNVHQMISTVSGELKEKSIFSDIIRATFPMGSMTGAPKHRVMELIDRYETSARGIFSGSVGYINPEGDFDFNVVIRSIMYNASRRYLSYQVGSGITFYSQPEKEWEECLLKAEAIKKVLTGQSALSE
jgi:para-aminobenzoate synthetase component I